MEGNELKIKYLKFHTLPQGEDERETIYITTDRLKNKEGNDRVIGVIVKYDNKIYSFKGSESICYTGETLKLISKVIDRLNLGVYEYDKLGGLIVCINH